MEAVARREPVVNARRVVIKLGTRAISNEAGGLDIDRLGALVSTVSTLHRRGTEVIIVSSGAVGLGAHQLQMALPVRSLVNRQAAAGGGTRTHE